MKSLANRNELRGITYTQKVPSRLCYYLYSEEMITRTDP